MTSSAPSSPSPITIIAAVAANGVIGRDGGLPWRLPGELARVKQLTMGHVLLMGRRTYESIGRPLPGRVTVVVTRQPEWRAEGVLVARSIDEAVDIAVAHGRQIDVFGGADIYVAMLPRADRMVITWVDATPDGDTVFPDVDWSCWREIRRDPGEGYTVVEYERT
ncbi:MAG TPA: dihydrofolate reductase [Nocardioidaceae bacterium]|nr:dihydrofolate reductase [Nocardioidaceae bacterium]